LLQLEWMNGIQFYLRQDVSMVRGHTIYYDSPWALTSISQRQFWGEEIVTLLNKNKVEGILSLCISDWNKTGIIYGKTAKESSYEEIKNEVLAQIRIELDADIAEQLNDDNIVTWYLASSIHDTPEGKIDAEPLMINVAGTYHYRPSAVTAIANLFLAADYVQTTTDLACMEGANEAARRAVNGIIKASGSNDLDCDLWELADFEELAYLREEDRVRFGQGFLNVFDL
uniref:FAD-dependent oxidoreductase n=1 Tax=Chamaesiphon sp. OTE_75_metabat_556 TaxID=2964692 RepID=UPI0037BE4B4B